MRRLPHVDEQEGSKLELGDVTCRTRARTCETAPGPVATPTPQSHPPHPAHCWSPPLSPPCPWLPGNGCPDGSMSCSLARRGHRTSMAAAATRLKRLVGSSLPSLFHSLFFPHPHFPLWSSLSETVPFRFLTFFHPTFPFILFTPLAL